MEISMFCSTGILVNKEPIPGLTMYKLQRRWVNSFAKWYVVAMAVYGLAVEDVKNCNKNFFSL